MRLATFDRAGVVSYGVVTDGGIVDLAFRRDERSVREVLERGRLADVARQVDGLAPDVGLDEVALLPPVLDSRKVLAVGMNYQSHRDEAQSERKIVVTTEPTVFTRFADSHVGHEAGIVKPRVSAAFDYEGELALVIGRESYRVGQAEAMQCVAGYACYNDATARDWQRHTSQWTLGKSHRRSGAFGPWLVTSDEVGELADHAVTTRVNGEQRQHAPISDLIFGIPKLIEYISHCTPLYPGDVIVTGTSSGVGAALDPPRLLNVGDVVEIECSCVGTLRNTVVADPF
jgi:2-keto-4-pentenoate hydratase/2-oxohepta-3-ene-1,7-dioic acid hydratase in catechol pathway